MVEVAPDLPVVRADRRRLVEVLQNLLENAGKFTGEQARPRIEIGWRRDAAEPVFFVRDNGQGIEERFLERVFGLFEKLDPGGEETGVGLALVRRIVEAHGGSAWAESEGAGAGASFCFTLFKGGSGAFSPDEPGPASPAAFPRPSARLSLLAVSPGLLPGRPAGLARPAAAGTARPRGRASEPGAPRAAAPAGSRAPSGTGRS